MGHIVCAYSMTIDIRGVVNLSLAVRTCQDCYQNELADFVTDIH